MDCHSVNMDILNSFGYWVSNAKLLATCFDMRYSLVLRSWPCNPVATTISEIQISTVDNRASPRDRIPHEGGYDSSG
jgi:hypothetical protein